MAGQSHVHELPFQKGMIILAVLDLLWDQSNTKIISMLIFKKLICSDQYISGYFKKTTISFIPA